MATGRVLLVEDDFLIRLTLSESLRDDGFDVIEAADTDEAVTAIDQGGLQMLITDVQIPGTLNGIGVAEHAWRLCPDLPVIFITGRPDAVPDCGMNRSLVMAKPYLPSEICAAARSMLAVSL